VQSESITREPLHRRQAHRTGATGAATAVPQGPDEAAAQAKQLGPDVEEPFTAHTAASQPDLKLPAVSGGV